MVRLISCEIIFAEFEPMITIPQRYRQTDGETDRQTTLALAIARSARLRAIKIDSIIDTWRIVQRHSDKLICVQCARMWQEKRFGCCELFKSCQNISQEKIVQRSIKSMVGSLLLHISVKVSWKKSRPVFHAVMIETLWLTFTFWTTLYIQSVNIG